jgi:glycosyltransferase involved in cell wall biosynthesis
MTIKLAILWSHPASYLYAAIESATASGAQVLLSCFKSGAKAPYRLDNSIFRNGNTRLEWDDAQSIDTDAVLQALGELQPQILIISGWNHPNYMKIARRYRGRAMRLLAMDNQWEATPRQMLGAAMSRYLIQPYFDYAFVPGERQYQFAKRLGFRDDRIIDGLFTCDPAFYQAPPDERARRGFIYVGRLSQEKGIHTLLSAYARYRDSTSRPWELHLYGAGKEVAKERLPQGAHLHGFIQPEQLPSLLQSHQAFVMPSHWEPWGVAIHEAASAGLPLICSACCGAAVHLVKDNFNGYTCKPGDIAGLSSAMGKVSTLEAHELHAMADNGRKLAAQFHPDIWFSGLLGQLPRIGSVSAGLPS